MIPFSHSNRQKFAPSPFSPSGTLLTAAFVMVPQYMVWRQEVYLYAVCWSYEKCVINITEVLPRSWWHHFKVAPLQSGSATLPDPSASAGTATHSASAPACAPPGSCCRRRAAALRG